MQWVLIILYVISHEVDSLINFVKNGVAVDFPAGIGSPSFQLLSRGFRNDVLKPRITTPGRTFRTDKIHGQVNDEPRPSGKTRGGGRTDGNIRPCSQRSVEEHGIAKASEMLRDTGGFTEKEE